MMSKRLLLNPLRCLSVGEGSRSPLRKERQPFDSETHQEAKKETRGLVGTWPD